MGYLVDSHCHLHDREFFDAEETETALKRARENGVQKIICIGTSHEDSLAAAEFARGREDVFYTYGVHPENAGGATSVCAVEPAILKNAVAIGEVGLDYHYDGYARDAQIRLFNEMLQLATDCDLPVSFHIREAFDDFFPVIENFPKLRGVVHSFTDSKKVLKRILMATDFYVGVNGLSTYTTLATPPLERILLETDAPFLAPVPYRGQTNEPAYIKNIAEWLSGKLDIPMEQVAETTTRNAETLFRLNGGT